MQESFLFILVLVGFPFTVIGLVLLNIVTKTAGEKCFATLQDARHAVENSVFGFVVLKPGYLGDDKMAFISFEHGGERLALARWLGDRSVVRAICRDDIMNITAKCDTLIVKMKDYTFPEVKLQINDTKHREAWHQHLKCFVQGKNKVDAKPN